MAKPKGLLRFTGTLHGITGVNSREGHHLRAKQQIPAERYRTAAEYAAFRENGRLMAEAARLSKAFRLALGDFTANVSNNRMYSRLNAALRRLAQQQATGETVDPTLLQMALGGFEFQRDRPLLGTLSAPYRVEGTEVVIRLQTAHDLTAPKGATQLRLCCGLAGGDFDTGTFWFAVGDVVTLELPGTYPGTVTLPIPQPPAPGPGLLLLRACFADLQAGQPRELTGSMKVIGTF